MSTGRRVTRILVLTLALLTLGGLVPTVALADLTGGANTGGTGGGVVNPIPPPSTGGGVVSQPDPIYDPRYTAAPTMNPPGTPDITCAPLDAEGDPFIGYRAWTYVTGEERVNGELRWRYECAYAPGVTRVLRCGWDVGGVGQGPTTLTSMIGSAPTVTFPRSQTPFANGDHSEGACAASWAASWSLPLQGLGYWQIQAQGTQASCSWRESQGFAPRFLGCSGPIALPTRFYKATTWCGGQDLSQWVYNADAGGPNDLFSLNRCVNSAWSCAISNPTPTYDALGLGPVFEIHDDGKNRLASWEQPRLSGVSNVSSQRMRLNYLSGTPFRTGQAAWGSTQPFVATPQIGSWVSGWQGKEGTAGHSGWLINWQQAGYPGKPWTAQPQWTFTGTITYQGTVITGLELRTGALTVGHVPQTTTAPGSCVATPIQVNVVRARTSN